MLIKQLLKSKKHFKTIYRPSSQTLFKIDIYPNPICVTRKQEDTIVNGELLKKSLKNMFDVQMVGNLGN